MKIVYDKRYTGVYENDPAAAPGRMEPIAKELASFEFVQPKSAREDDILLCHTQSHISYIRSDVRLFEMAMLAAGGALEAADLAAQGEAAFAAIRPPGHHASADSCWGFCFFNNIAIAVSWLLENGKIKSALILDFDLHFGDGTHNIFEANPAVTYFHPEDVTGKGFIEKVNSHLNTCQADMIAVSAGFDRHVEDWGRLLTTEDYRTIGGIVKEYALNNCKGGRFGVLEGGYNHSVLGKNVRAFVEGMA
ncbi:MAG: histone deacetylase family protein [Dehalococcoidia bacterium]|nr:histone deacetylase family protein [Dehalococcoidia bacterium]